MCAFLATDFQWHAIIAIRAFSTTFTIKVFRKLSIRAILTSIRKFVFAWIASTTDIRNKRKNKKIRKKNKRKFNC